MWRVSQRLYLGDYRAGELALRGEPPIDAPPEEHAPFIGVVSLCKMPLVPGTELPTPPTPTLEWLHAPIQDGGNGEREFELVLALVLPFAARLRSRGNVLVHCAAGMSRSVAVCAALLCESAEAPDARAALAQIGNAKAATLRVQRPLAELIAPAAEFVSLLDRRYPQLAH